MSAVAEAPPDLSKMTLEQVFEEYKKLPDWNRWPLPEVFYKTFDVKKPQPQTVQEITSFNSMNYIYFGEKAAETRGPAEGGVREIGQLDPLPVSVKRINEETGELEDYPPPPDPAEHIGRKTFEEFLMKFTKAQNADDKPQYLTTDSSNLPIKDNTTETQPE